MTHFHRVISFTLNESRLIHFDGGGTPDTFAKNQAESMRQVPENSKETPVVTNAAETANAGTHRMQVSRIFLEQQKNKVASVPSNVVDPKNNISNVSADGIPPSPTPEQSSLPPLQQTPIPVDAVPDAGGVEQEGVSKKNQSSPDSSKTSEKPIAEPKATPDAQNNQPPAPEVKKERPEATTHGQKLENDMQDAMDVLNNPEAKSTEKFAAVMKMLGAIAEYGNRAFNQTLDEPLKKDQPSDQNNTAANISSENGNKPSKTPAESATQKLEDNAKPKDGKEAPKDLRQNVEQVKEKNRAERDRNTQEIKELDTTIVETKKENDSFIDQRSALEKQLNGLQGQEGVEGKQQTLKSRIENINQKIEANTKLIEKLDNQRDALEKKNEILNKEDEALDKMKEGATDVMKNMQEMMKTLTDTLLHNVGLKDIPTFSIEIGKDGKPIIVAIGGSKEMRDQIQQYAAKAGLQIEMRDAQTSSATPAKESKSPEQPKENQPSVNEIQNRRLTVVSGQIRSLAGDGIQIKGSAYVGAEFQTKDGLQVRYENSARQWQVKSPIEKTWQNPSNYEMGNSDIANKLKVFIQELDGLRQQEDEARKREQTA